MGGWDGVAIANEKDGKATPVAVCPSSDRTLAHIGGNTLVFHHQATSAHRRHGFPITETGGELFSRPARKAAD